MNPLVSAAWLAARLAQQNVVVLDATLPPVGVSPAVDVQARYREQHIPGAVFFDIEDLSDKATTLPHMLPSEADFGQRMGALGLNETTTLVVYEQGNVFSAPRAWWMLRSMGATDVHVLDGGLQAWIDAGYEAEAGVVSLPPAVFHATQTPGAVSSLVALQHALANGTEGAQVLDARSPGRFAGTSPEPRPGLSSGHMPGAINVPYTELVWETRMKGRPELLEAFKAHGVALGVPITTSCGSGVTAAVLVLGLELCDAPGVSLYDGSWTEYAQQPDAVIAKT